MENKTKTFDRFRRSADSYIDGYRNYGRLQIELYMRIIINRSGYIFLRIRPTNHPR